MLCYGSIRFKLKTSIFNWDIAIRAIRNLAHWSFLKVDMLFYAAKWLIYLLSVCPWRCVPVLSMASPPLSTHPSITGDTEAYHINSTPHRISIFTRNQYWCLSFWWMLPFLRRLNDSLPCYFEVSLYGFVFMNFPIYHVSMWVISGEPSWDYLISSYPQVLSVPLWSLVMTAAAAAVPVGYCGKSQCLYHDLSIVFNLTH